MTLSREDFDRIETKPGNYLFFVLDKVVKDESIIDVYSLYKGNVQVGVGDIIGALPDSMKAANGGFRAMAFTRSEEKPNKPRESDFGSYYDLVNSHGVWQARPDNLSGTAPVWVSYHWFTGSPAEALDTGDVWTEPVRLTGLNGADGTNGINGANGRDGINGADGKDGKDGENGTGVFIRFNSAVSMPERPTGIGIDGGWSSNQKEDSRWISLKQGKTASEGTWGEPVQIKCNLVKYDASDGSIRDEFGNFLGMAFSPVYTIDTEQVIPLTVLDRYKFDTQEPLRVNCYVSTPQGSRALLNPEAYSLMCKVGDSRQTPVEELTFELEYANREWLLPLEDWYDKSNATDFIELHLFKKDAPGNSALSIKLIELVRDGETGKITSVKAETLEPGSLATVRNEGDIHDAQLVFGIPRGDKGEKGDTGEAGKDGYGVFYASTVYDTALPVQISRVFIQTEGRSLQVGDFVIEASDNKRIFRIASLTSNYAYCDPIGSLRGKAGEDGFGIYYTAASYDTEDDHCQMQTKWIQNLGKKLQTGDLILEASENKYLWQIESFFGEGDNEQAMCVNRGRLKGDKGDKGERGEKGEKGDKGDPFMVRKTYPSVEAMNADFDNPDVPLYGMVLIDTGNVEDAENAKLYMKGETEFSFLTDLSGAQGIKGDTGYSFRKGVVDSVSENGEVVFTSITPAQGLQAGDIIVGFNESLGFYGQLFRTTDAANLTGTDLGVSLRGAQGLQGLRGVQGVQGERGMTGFGTYRTAAHMTAIEADYSLQKSEVDTLGRVLQVGDLLLEGSPDSYLWRIKEIPEGGSTVKCEYICSLRGQKGDSGARGEEGMQGIPGADGLNGFGIYRMNQSRTVNTIYSGLSITGHFNSDLSLLGGRTLQVGDFAIETSVYSYMYKITAVTDTTFDCERVCSLRGATGATGATGASGAEGLGIWRSAISATPSTTVLPLESISIPEGRSVKVGDLIIANSTYSYLFRVIAVSSTAASITYLTSLRGATGAAGQNATTTAVASTTANGLMSAADKTKLNGAVVTGFPTSNNLKPVMKDASDRGYVKMFDYTALGETLEDDVWSNIYETDGMNVHDKKLPIIRVAKDQAPDRSWVNTPVAAQQSGSSNFMALFSAYATESYNIRLDAFAFKNKIRTDAFNVCFSPDTANNSLNITWERGGISQSAKIRHGVDAAGIVAAGTYSLSTKVVSFTKGSGTISNPSTGLYRLTVNGDTGNSILLISSSYLTANSIYSKGTSSTIYQIGIRLPTSNTAANGDFSFVLIQV